MADDKEKQLEKTVESINQGIESLKEGLNKKADIETLEKKYEEINGKLENVVGAESFNKQQEQLDQISTDIKKLGENQGKTEKNNLQIIEENLNNDEFKKAVKNVPDGNRQIKSFLVKASGDVTTSDINSGSIRTEYEPGVAKHPWKQTPFWDLMPKGVIGSGRDSKSWWEELSRLDNAAMVSETGSANQSSIDWVKKTLDVQHINAWTKVSRSSLEDWEDTRSEVLDLLQNELPRKIEQQILDGDGLSNNLTGLITQAKAFSKPDNFKKVDNPNYIDYIRAVMTQIMNGDTTDVNKKGYMPNIVGVNQGDLMNLRGMKDANGQYIIPPLGSGVTNIDGVRLVPSLDLDPDEFVMLDMSLPKAYIKRDMQVSFHYENEDDAKKDLVMIQVRMRIAGVKLATQHKFGVVTGSWDNVKTAIDAGTA